MGNSKLSSADWVSYSNAKSYATANHHTVLTSSTINDKMLPKNIDVREARDSVLNPNSLPIIIALDCTGSMNSIIVKCITKMGMIIDELVTKKAVTDPAIMSMFFDDVEYITNGALQVTQFESDLEAVKQIEGMHKTGMGGGNSCESYHLPLYMAAFKTRTDSYEKRGKRGYMFVMGDEGKPPALTKKQIQSVFGNDESVSQDSFTYDELLESAQRYYDVFHVVVMEGSHAKYQGSDKMTAQWAIHGQNLIILDDVESLPEVIVSTIRLREGHDRDDVISAWSGSTAVSVAAATGNIVKGDSSTSSDASVVEL